jgi:hypothetical protein
MIRILTLAIFLSTSVSAAPLTQRSEREAYDWGGLREISKEGNFPKSPEGRAFSYRVWLQSKYLAECAYGPGCESKRLMIWLGSDDIGGRPALFQTSPSFDWQVLAIENGTTPRGDQECVVFVLQQTFWENGQSHETSSTRDHRVCLRAETWEEVNKRIAQQKRKQRATAQSKLVK